MKTPKNFIDADTPWCDWNSISTGEHSKKFYTRTVKRDNALYSPSTVEATYPGFISVYDTLVSIGCDSYLVTDVLKHCILQSNATPLDEFLVQSNTLKMVETALAIGLSGEELVKLLMTSSPAVVASELPADFAYVSAP